MTENITAKTVALHTAGATLVRHAIEAGVDPRYLAKSIELQGDIDYLAEVARKHGLAGMPSGYSNPIAPEWEAVFAGVQEALVECADQIAAFAADCEGIRVQDYATNSMLRIATGDDIARAAGADTCTGTFRDEHGRTVFLYGVRFDGDRYVFGSD